ncbi:MurR/RpiR family transcriptional regulator [Neobacillus sp. SuZ13]|uniref:MurR/RpiR family transcriptional regulator n=1 Tax=Neobacillus sp. SuZ13 TaxID=3047875 RepID=UPI0024C093A9|nr:MurR/RpiR family transcriptional regulator [Neobacillus sp. SuZ13]WHY68952.1 MurR/RpiR family transcriptional regulator [Neobacillus sp. SuZ13]
MKTNVIQLIQNKAPELTESQRKVADYIIKNAMDVAFLTVDQLAGLVGTSTTTIMRMAFKLGFSGYAEFQKELQELLRNRVDPQTRLQVNLKEIDESDLLVRCAEKQIENIRSTMDLIDSQTLNKMMDMICSANQIYCLGSRTSKPVAQFLNQGFNRLFGNSHLPNEDEWPEKVTNFSPSDLVIIISFPRYSSKMINMARVAKQNNAKIISITDGYSSPLVGYTDLLLPCSYQSIAFHNSIIGPMFIADYLISAIAINYSDKTKERFKSIEPIITDLGYHYLD